MIIYPNDHPLSVPISLRLSNVNIIIGDYKKLPICDLQQFRNSLPIVVFSSLCVYDEYTWNQTEDGEIFSTSERAQYYLELEKTIKSTFSQYYILRLPTYVIGYGIPLPEQINLKICQIYDLDYLSREVDMMMSNNITLLNLVTQPCMLQDLQSIYDVTQNDNHDTTMVEKYVTKHDSNQYLLSCNDVINKITRIKRVDTDCTENVIVCSSNWTLENHDKAIKVLKMFGIQYMCLDGSKIQWDKINIHDLAQQIRESDIKVIAIDNIFSTTQINVFKDEDLFLNHFQKVIGFASICGIKFIVFSDASPQYIHGIYQKDWFDYVCASHEKFVSIMKALSHIAQQQNITIVIDKNKQTNYIVTSTDACTVVKSIEHGCCKYAEYCPIAVQEEECCGMLMIEDVSIKQMNHLCKKQICIKKHGQTIQSLINTLGTFTSLGDCQELD